MIILTFILFRNDLMKSNGLIFEISDCLITLRMTPQISCRVIQNGPFNHIKNQLLL
jgi:hypothetical protein